MSTNYYVNYGYSSTTGTYAIHRIYGAHFSAENAVAVNYTNTINGYKTIDIFFLNPDNPYASETATCERNDASTFSTTVSLAPGFSPYENIYMLTDTITDIGGVGPDPFAIGLDVLDVSDIYDFGQSNMTIFAAVDAYFNQPTTATCEFNLYTLGRGHTTLYTLIAENLTPVSPLTDADYDIFIGVTAYSDRDGAQFATFPYNQYKVEFSYDAVYSALYDNEEEQADTQGYFYIKAILRHTENGDAVIDQEQYFTISTTTAEIIDSSPDINIYVDTPPESDQHYNTDEDELEGQAPGQNLSVDNLLTTSYVLTESELIAFGQFMWANDLTTTMYAYQTAPIENILSCKRIPFEETGTPAPMPDGIKLGNVATGITADIVNSSHRKVIGTFSLPTNKFKPWMAFSDFVQVSIYLPYIGIVKVPNTLCWRKTSSNGIAARTVQVEYIYDILLGSCAAILSVYDATLQDYVMFASYNGQCSIDIPITASNRSEIELSLIKTGVNGVAGSLTRFVEGMTTGNIGGALVGTVGDLFSTYARYKADQITADTHYQTSGGISSQVASLMSNGVYVFMEYPDYTEPDTYAHEYGYPCNISLNLSGLSGYTEIEHGVDFSGIPAFNEELEILEQFLTSGFYL